jgi:hypothetical protein
VALDAPQRRPKTTKLPFPSLPFPSTLPRPYPNPNFSILAVSNQPVRGW